ncbi:MAG: hypothetical protein K2H43_06810, partial [Clostridia bacterium]|nr:hypothetical protein [Clostridia bacterium]
MPTRLSKDDDGNAILTLWLAKIEQTTNVWAETGLTIYDQESSPLSDGTYSIDRVSNAASKKSYTENGNTYSVFSHTYDSSYLRHVVLGLTDDEAFRSSYTQAWGYYWSLGVNKRLAVSGTRVNLPAANTMNKFRQLTMGDLAQYVVTPNKVAWQMAQSDYPNDPAFNNATYKVNYPCNWVGDKIWLPSLSDFAANSWNLTQSQKSFTEEYYVRSASYMHTHNASTMEWQNWDGTGYEGDYTHDTLTPVRPAFHLNLSMIANQFIDVPEVKSSTTFTYTGLEQELDVSDTSLVTGFDASKMEVASITRKSDGATGAVAPTVVAASSPNVPTKVKFTDAGTYEITLKTRQGTINGSTQYYFWNTKVAENSQTETKIEFTVKKKQLTKPAFTAASSQKDYNGTQLTFNAPNYPNDTVASTTSVAYPKDPLSASITRKVNGTVSAPPYTPVTE